ncbi:MAG: universal stress protein [Methanosarcinales archaeon]|nr:universal stress protein [Methanosarcinales archaeon]
MNTIIAAFSATYIHDRLARDALDMAQKHGADLIILSVRDKNIANKVARLTHDHGFLGEKVVERLKEDIKAGRNGIISRRLGLVEKEAKKRGVDFEIVRVKGDFVEMVVEVVSRYGADVVLIEEMGRVGDELRRMGGFDVVVVE